MVFSHYEDKDKNIKLAHKIIDDCYVDDSMPEDFIKEKAKIFLSSLIALRNFQVPKIFPTLRNTIQFEWEIFPDIEKHDESYYLEFEIYSDKISMLYCNTINKDFYYNCKEFCEDSIGNDIWHIFTFLDAMEKDKDSYVTQFLELFTVKE